MIEPPEYHGNRTFETQIGHLVHCAHCSAARTRDQGGICRQSLSPPATALLGRLRRVRSSSRCGHSKFRKEGIPEGGLLPACPTAREPRA